MSNKELSADDRFLAERAEAALLGDHFLRKVIIHEKYRWEENPKDEDDKKWPKRFFQVSQYKKSQEMADFEIFHSFHVDDIETAVASAVLVHFIKGPHYKAIKPEDMPKRLRLWRETKFTLEERINRKEKWGELRVNKRCGGTSEVLVNGKWKTDFTFGGNLNYALTSIPYRWANWCEGQTPYYLDYHNVDEPDESMYPCFSYHGNYFRTTHYFPDQKAICGESIDGKYKNDWEDDSSIKVEVNYGVQCFEKDIIHLEAGKVIFNASVTEYEGSMFDGLDIDNNRELIAKYYPTAKRVKTMMEDWSLKPRKMAQGVAE